MRDLRLGERLRPGMNLRTHAMGHQVHEHGGHQSADADTGIELEPEAAAQVQFYASYSL